jgi:tetratricopeptide (TPR) repeat protein
LELRAHVELVTHDFVRGKRTAHEAAEFLDAALSAFEQADDLVGIVRGSLMYSQLLDWNKRVDGALVHLERAQAAYRRLGRGGHVDSVLIVHAMRGRTSVPEATILAERSLERHGDGPRAHAYTLVYTAYLRGLAGDAVAAREAVTAARSELHELGEEVGLGTSAVALIGDTESFIGDWGRMKEVFEEGLEYTRDRPEHREWHAYFLARLGEAALEQGDAQAAADLAEQSRAIAVAADMETSIWWRRVAARAAAAMGHSRKARRLGREALALADDTEEVLLRSGARIDLADVHLAGGRRAEALSVVREALELLDRKGAVALSARARERFATLLSEREDAVRAVPPGQVS